MGKKCFELVIIYLLKWKTENTWNILIDNSGKLMDKDNVKKIFRDWEFSQCNKLDFTWLYVSGYSFEITRKIFCGGPNHYLPFLLSPLPLGRVLHQIPLRVLTLSFYIPLHKSYLLTLWLHKADFVREV